LVAHKTYIVLLTVGGRILQIKQQGYVFKYAQTDILHKIKQLNAI